MIDEVAKERAHKKHGLPLCLLVPIAAVNEQAIRYYVGDVVATLSGGSSPRALLVRAFPPAPADPSIPIWKEPGADVFHRPLQVWVHIAFTRYRRAWQRAFPDEDLGERVLSHTMNRRTAALKGFDFVRLTPTSRSANSSSAFSEGWAVALHREPSQMKANRRSGMFIQYADYTDLMLMLDMKLGGGVMDAANEGRKLIWPRGQLG